MKDFEKEKYPIFQMFNDNWALVSAGTIDDFNTCTIAWGSLGTIWGRPHSGRSVATVYVHPARYTNEFLKKYDYFTISFYDPKYKKALAYLGSHSKRDEDKVKTSGLNAISYGDSVTFKEAELTFLCHKLYFYKFNKEGLNDEIKAYYAASPSAYPNITNEDTDTWQAHDIIIGEIIDCK